MTAINMSRRQALLGTAAMAGVTTLGAMPVPSVQAKRRREQKKPDSGEQFFRMDWS